MHCEFDHQTVWARQLDGGLSYTTTAGKLAPMFVTNNAAVSVTLGEVCYSGHPFTTILSETRGGQAKMLSRTDPAYGQRLLLYSGHGETAGTAQRAHPH